MKDLGLVAMQAAFSVSTNQQFLKLCTLSHPDWEETLRFVCDSQDVESNGETYKARWFEAEPPNDSGSELVTVAFGINNVDQLLTPLIMAVRQDPIPVTVTWCQVLRSAPDTVLDDDVRSFESRDYQFTLEGVQCALVGDINAREKVPADLQGRALNPGLSEEA